jgi:hypothetical protein
VGDLESDTTSLTQRYHWPSEAVQDEHSADDLDNDATGSKFGHELTRTSHRPSDAVKLVPVERSVDDEERDMLLDGIQNAPGAIKITHEATGTAHRPSDAVLQSSVSADLDNDVIGRFSAKKSRSRSGLDQKGTFNRESDTPVVRRKSSRFYAD